MHPDELLFCLAYLYSARGLQRTTAYDNLFSCSTNLCILRFKGHAARCCSWFFRAEARIHRISIVKDRALSFRTSAPGLILAVPVSGHKSYSGDNYDEYCKYYLSHNRLKLLKILNSAGSKTVG